MIRNKKLLVKKGTLVGFIHAHVYSQLAHILFGTHLENN